MAIEYMKNAFRISIVDENYNSEDIEAADNIDDAKSKCLKLMGENPDDKFQIEIYHGDPRIQMSKMYYDEEDKIWIEGSLP